ncbi:MAG: 16S rRNA (guanine(966)-N(2))-methyltransferase RsmD [Paludibacteraceae bacterium]
MRIIGGKYKARRIDVPHNITARPTTDFAKEGLFNLLNNRIDFEGIDVLDLFAGTGSISLEFISREASSVISVEQSERHCTFIRKVCKELNIYNLMLVKGDVFRYIISTKIKFNVIFADPPYELDKLSEIPDLILNYKLLKPDGLLVLEHSAKNNFENHPNFVLHRHYGNVNFSFFEVG